MGNYFGHNCINYLPTIGKCRVLVANYLQRPDLLGLKWMRTQDLLVYGGSSQEALLQQIASAAVRVRRIKKDGSLRFGVQASWKWDDCHAVSGGSQCMYYRPHFGAQIRRLKDLQSWPHQHPNMGALPQESEIASFEDQVVRVAPFIETRAKPEDGI